MSINYQAVFNDLSTKIDNKKLTNKFHRRFAWSTDASYFRILPEIVVHANNLEEIKHALLIADRYDAPITFRAAGTSLSGQAIGEGILLIMGVDAFRKITINNDASQISLEAGVIGSEANAVLKPFNKKIGPDPATLAVAKIGGIVANNSSGMCCGTAQNSYQTIASAKLVFANGAELDTASSSSKAAFAKYYALFLHELSQLAEQTKANRALSQRIKQKYKIKNTTGYSLNALIDYSDPFDIINHLIVGSEGTLAFVEEVTYQTVEDAPFKASALAVFNNMEEAANAIPLLQKKEVSAVELLDFSSIKALIGKKGMPEWLNQLPDKSTILLIESRAENQSKLDEQLKDILHALSFFKLQRTMQFTQDPKVYEQYWSMRSALFPIVAGERKKGTSVIIEDIAFQTRDLASAAKDLTSLFHKHGYPEGIIFGHALVGNLHFVITPAFNHAADIEQFRLFMQDVTDMVLNKYQGSMKAEHGTGRAVAPFVEMEWGKEAYSLMKKIKQLFDPKSILNPGVILNDDKEAHIKNIKPSPKVDALIDKCIECGFCEKTCPTSALSMSPRQRIATLREISRLEQNEEKAKAEQLRKASKYDLVDTCISCQLCSISCPVDIGMGELANKLRSEYISSIEQTRLNLQAKHFAKTNQAIRSGLNLLDIVHQHAGSKITQTIFQTVRKINKNVPNWNTSFPKASPQTRSTPLLENQQTVVYFPACGGRLFGATPQDKNSISLPETVETLFERAGINVIKPENTQELCCGQLWQSKGDLKNASMKHQEFIQAIFQTSQQGKLPVILDALSCSYRSISANPDIQDKIQLIDLIDFIHDYLLDKLSINIKKPAITLHLGCSARKMEIEPKMQTIAKACAHHIVYPERIDCCGYAGEKGMYFPEISETSLRNLKQLIPENVKEGYYANRMCELGLTQHSGISYRHLAYLLEECSR